MGNPHIGVLVTMSAFTYTRKNVHPDSPRNIKNARLQQSNALVGDEYPWILSHDGI
jgi:hypothetical protein